MEQKTNQSKDVELSESTKERGSRLASLADSEEVTAIGGIESNESGESLLEERAYVELDITIQDEEVRIKELQENGATPERIEQEKRSFNNIRETVSIYFQKLTEEGIFNTDELIAFEKEARSLSRDELLKQYLEGSDFLDVETMENLDGKINELIKAREGVERELGVHTFMDEEEYTEITQDERIVEINQQLEALKEIRAKITSVQALDITGGDVQRANKKIEEKVRGKIEEGRLVISFDKALETLLLEISRVRLGHEVTLNCHTGALTKIAESGEIVSSASLDRERLEDLAKAITETNESGRDLRYKSASSAEQYMRQRASVEEELGYNPGEIIYGAISTDEEPLGHTVYGECCIVIEPSSISGVMFTEGDSLSQRNMGFYSEKGSKRTGKQLSYEHALISQAVTRSFHGIERERLGGYDSDDYMEYLEAQIPSPVSFDSSSIKEIRVSGSVDRGSLPQVGEIPIRVVA